MNTSNTPKLHPMYQQMVDNGFSMEEVSSLGGYFANGYIPTDEELRLTSKINSLRDCDMVVGISGAFNPIHEGHLECIKLAVAEFSRMGYKKVGAVVFPAHDSYALTKAGGAPFSERLAQIQEFLSGRNLIVEDIVPAAKWGGEVNFPYLVDRMQKICPYSHTAFIFGADNAGFAYAFENSPTWAVVVERGDIALDLNKLKNTKLKLIKYNFYSGVSSTIKREKPIYAVRDDSYFSCYLSGGVKPKLTPEKLAERIQHFFPQTEVVLFDAVEQCKQVEKWLSTNTSDSAVISLDKWFSPLQPWAFDLDVSRLFQIGGHNEPISEKFLGLLYRESQFDIVRSQVRKAKKIVFVDDDIATGATKQKIMELTESWGQPREFISMLDFVSGMRRVFDVVDYRDFIPSTRHGGLLTLGGRVCYTDPRIDLTKRMKFESLAAAQEFKKSLKEYRD